MLPYRLPRAVLKGSVREYQIKLKEKLSLIFPADSVEIEWAAMADERALYSPRLDAAVGPFATHRIYEQEYDQMVRDHELLLVRLFDLHRSNLRTFGQPDGHFSFAHMCSRNFNARCFLAFEIENVVSRKHLMGGAINAAALGRIGLAIAWNQEKLRAFVRMRSYLLFLTEVGKNSFDPSNLLILTKEQLMDAIEMSISERQPRRLKKKAVVPAK